MGNLRRASAVAGFVVGMLASMSGGAALINSDQVVVDGNHPTPVIRSIVVDAADVGVGKSIVDLDVKLDFMKCAGSLTTPLPPADCPSGGDARAEEIFFYLRSPSGTDVTLVFFDSYTAPGPNPGARIEVTFDDEAGTPVGGTNFSTGPFQPFDQLGFFDNEDPLGEWQLFITDRTGGAPLGFARLELLFTVQNAAGMPIPATALLLGLGLAGIAVSRKRLN